MGNCSHAYEKSNKNQEMTIKNLGRGLSCIEEETLTDSEKTNGKERDGLWAKRTEGRLDPTHWGKED